MNSEPASALHLDLRPDELWWGGAVPDGQAMPFGDRPHRRDLATNAGLLDHPGDGANQSAPLLVSSTGRYVWSELPFTFAFDGVGGLDIVGTGVVVGRADDSLAAAHRAVSRRYFPASGAIPAEQMCTAPQYNTWMEMPYRPTQEGVLAYARGILDAGFPPGLIMIDDRWSRDYGAWQFDGAQFPDPRVMVEQLHAWGFSVMVMVGQRDLGSSLLFFTLFVVMMWVATERVTYLVFGVVLFAGAAYMAWRMFDHVQTRVAIWRDPWEDEYDKGFQIVQAIYGIGDGGITGTGLGRGSPDKVPEAQNDFIFAAIGEEMGMIGATALLMSYLLIIGAGLRVALRTDRTFDKLLATGLTTIIGVQAFIIIGGVIKVVPLTGITLPFVSYGGSSLLSNYIILALLLRLSDAGARRLGELPDDPTPRERWAAWNLRRQVKRNPSLADASPLDAVTT